MFLICPLALPVRLWVVCRRGQETGVQLIKDCPPKLAEPQRVTVADQDGRDAPVMAEEGGKPTNGPILGGPTDTGSVMGAGAVRKRSGVMGSSRWCNVLVNLHVRQL